jgi:hypothetical protein
MADHISVTAPADVRELHRPISSPDTASIRHESASCGCLAALRMPRMPAKLARWVGGRRTSGAAGTPVSAGQDPLPVDGEAAVLSLVTLPVALAC